MLKLKNLFKPGNLLKAAIFFLVVSIFYLGLYIFALTHKPEQVDEELLSTRGKFIAIAASTQRGTAFIIKREPDAKLVQLLIIPGYTNLQSGFSASIGKTIEVKHYGKLATSCRIDGIEFCISDCTNAYECRINLYNTDTASVKSMLLMCSLLTILCLTTYLLKRNQEHRK